MHAGTQVLASDIFIGDLFASSFSMGFWESRVGPERWMGWQRPPHPLLLPTARTQLLEVTLSGKEESAAVNEEEEEEVNKELERQRLSTRSATET